MFAYCVHVYKINIPPHNFALGRVRFAFLASHWYIQSNLDSSNTYGSFTMAYSNSFLSSYEILPIAEENKYLGKFIISS